MLFRSDLMTRIRIHISNVKLPFYPPYEVKYRLQNGVSTVSWEAFIVEVATLIVLSR